MQMSFGKKNFKFDQPTVRHSAGNILLIAAMVIGLLWFGSFISKNSDTIGSMWRTLGSIAIIWTAYKLFIPWRNRRKSL